jgi:hypothetical protein
VIKRQNFINKLRELGYTYADQSKKMQTWRKVGGTHHVAIRRKEDPLSEDYVRQVLRQCGETEDAIDQFIGANRQI